MSRGRLLLLFLAAGLILAVVLGFYFYRSNLSPNQDDVTALLQKFTESISSGRRTCADLFGLPSDRTADAGGYGR